MDKKKDLFKESAHVVVRTGKFEICRTETQGRVDVPFHIHTCTQAPVKREI